MNATKLARPSRQEEVKVNREAFLRNDQPRAGVATQPAGPIKIALTEINGALNRLHESISRAENTFEPVLTGGSDEVGKEPCAPDPSCPQLRELNDVLRVINRACERVDVLINRSAL